MDPATTRPAPAVVVHGAWSRRLHRQDPGAVAALPEHAPAVHRRLAPAAILALLVSGVLAACGGTPATPTPPASPAPSEGGASAAPSAGPSSGAIPTPEPGTFRMGTEPWLGYGPWWIAQEKGLFAANGLTVQLSSFDTDDQINAALVSGQLDGANIATHTALRLKSEGTPITIVLLLDQSNTADAIIAGPTIQSIADLKGKRVAYEEGTTSDILLRYALAQNGMTIDDIVKVPTPAAEAGVAVIAKRVDVAVTYEPYLTAALQQDPSYHILYSAKEKPGLIGDVFVVRNDVLASRPGQVFALLRTWGAAVDAYRANPTAGQAIIEKAVGAEPGSLKTAFDGVEIYSLADAKNLMAGAYLDTLAEVKTIATQAGMITNPVDEGAIMDTRFVTALAP
jgi:NitT/TauT family transport system substrate-binding protein